MRRTTDAITIAWDPANPDTLNCGPVLHYSVRITNLAISCDMRNFIVTVPSAEFSNLISGVAYAISVAAVNRIGVGVEAAINVTTLTVTVVTSERSQGF